MSQISLEHISESFEFATGELVYGVLRRQIGHVRVRAEVYALGGQLEIETFGRVLASLHVVANLYDRVSIFTTSVRKYGVTKRIFTSKAASNLHELLNHAVSAFVL